MTDNNNTDPTHPPAPEAERGATPPTSMEDWVVRNPDSKAEVPMMECETWIPPDYSYYSFTAMREFSAFCMAGHSGPNDTFTCPEFCLLSEEQEATTDSKVADQAKNACSHFVKAATNSVGGCGCNRSKRVEQAVKVYAETITKIAECPAMCDNIKKLLNSVERVHFWKDGEKYSNQARVFILSNSPRFDWRKAPPPSPFLII